MIAAAKCIAAVEILSSTNLYSEACAGPVRAQIMVAVAPIEWHNPS